METQNTIRLEDEYKKLFPNHEIFVESHEWRKEGDTIREFTLFDDYPPSYSSHYTEVIDLK